MEELKMLVEMVAKLPALAIWVLVMFWAYKVVVVGSVYGLIRFVVSKAHDYLVQQKTKSLDVVYKLGPLLITAEMENFMEQLKRVRGKGLTIQSDFIHHQSVNWLRDAIDDKIAKDAANKLRKD